MLLVIIFLLFAVACKAQTPVAQIPANYTLVYDEEFNEGLNFNSASVITASGPCGPGGSKYMAHTPYGGDFYSAGGSGGGWLNPGVDGWPFSTDNGYLDIKGWHTTGGDYSGMLSSVDRQGRGFSAAKAYWEAKIWCPVSNPQLASGLWPAFWLDAVNELGSTTDHSLGSEIDISEFYSNKYGFGQYQVATHEANGFLTQIQTGIDLSAGWHVYSCLIDDSLVHWYFDGKEVANTPASAQDKVPLYFMLDFAFFGYWPDAQNWGTDPGNGGAWSNTTDFKVAYVRVWTTSATPTPTPAPTPAAVHAVVDLSTLVKSLTWPYTEITSGTMDWNNYSATGFDSSDGKTSVVMFYYTAPESTGIRVTWKHPNASQISLIDLVTGVFTALPLVTWDNGQTVKANVTVNSHPQLIIIQ